MDYKKFFNQMQRLSSSEQRTMDDRFVKFWYGDMKRHGFTDADIEGGVTTLISKAIKFPNLGNLTEACKEAQNKRVSKECQRQKGEENKYRHTSQEEILERGTRGSLKARAFVTNILDLLNGRIDKRNWIKRQREIGVDGHAERELHRIEKDLPTPF